MRTDLDPTGELKAESAYRTNGPRTGSVRSADSGLRSPGTKVAAKLVRVNRLTSAAGDEPNCRSFLSQPPTRTDFGGGARSIVVSVRTAGSYRCFFG